MFPLAAGSPLNSRCFTELAVRLPLGLRRALDPPSHRPELFFKPEEDSDIFTKMAVCVCVSLYVSERTLMCVSEHVHQTNNQGPSSSNDPRCTRANTRQPHLRREKEPPSEEEQFSGKG